MIINNKIIQYDLRTPFKGNLVRIFAGKYERVYFLGVYVGIILLIHGNTLKTFYILIRNGTFRNWIILDKEQEMSAYIFDDLVNIVNQARVFMKENNINQSLTKLL